MSGGLVATLLDFVGLQNVGWVSPWSELLVACVVCWIATILGGLSWYYSQDFSIGSSTKVLSLPIPSKQSVFKPTKDLAEKDALMLQMLALESGESGKRACYVITDPEQTDNPIVFASDAFCSFTLYKKEDVEGRNCRFLQGPLTDKKDVKVIHDAVKAQKEASVQLLNYKRDGSTFINQFFLCPIHYAPEEGEERDVSRVAYLLGVQKEVDCVGKRKDAENEGWRLFMWL